MVLFNRKSKHLFEKKKSCRGLALLLSLSIVLPMFGDALAYTAEGPGFGGGTTTGTNSHEPIIDPAVYERVQRELSRRRSARPRKAGMDSPFANRLVCGDCGAFYGHKVWRSGSKNRNRYDVWYCNHRYGGEKKCGTPTLREDEIKNAFSKVLDKIGCPETEYTDACWRELVETVTIEKGRKATFLLTDGTEVTVIV